MLEALIDELREAADGVADYSYDTDPVNDVTRITLTNVICKSTSGVH